MKTKLAVLLVFFAAIGGSASAQNSASGNITASSTNCFSVLGSCVWEQPLPPNAATTTVNISGTFSATLLVEESNNGGQTWATAATLSSAGTTTYSTNSFTDIRVRCSAYVSGTAAVTISTGLNTGLQGPPGPGGGGITSVASLPATCTSGVTSPVQLSVAPFGLFYCSATNIWTQDNSPAIPTRGLIADYRMFPGDTVASLPDYSGKGNNATGTIGTAPTIIAGSGGIACPAAGGILLPAATQAALTITAYVSFQNSTATNTYESPIAGGVAGALASGAGIIFNQNPNSGFNGQAKVWWPQAFGAGFHVKARAATNGTFSVTMAMDTNDIIYINGIAEIDSGGILGSGASAGVMSGTNIYNICGVSNGGNPTYWQGNIYRIIMHNVVLTPTEVLQEAQAVAADGAARGVPQVFTPTGTASVFLAEGDSLTSNSNGNPPWPGALVIGGNPITIYNESLTGIRLVAALNHYPFSIRPLYNPNAERNVINIWGCTNDLANISTPATCFGQMMAMCRLAKADGFKVMLSTMVSRGGNSLVNGLATNDSLKNTLNTLIRNNFQLCADDLNDYAADPLIGADGANASATWFDGANLHPTQAAIYNIHAPLVNRGVARIYSANNFSGANVYVAPAAAATATTAGSCSTFTCTLTFASNPFPVGANLVCTGFTPAGYNSIAGHSWYVITTNATQITFWNSVSGLGAVSVQGSCSTPQQLDGDKYMIVNFGAGNFSLDTCVGYTGQNIYIRNINGVATTLLPFQSETITGSGTTTLAANTTAILQAQLVSASAAGCNWVRLQ